MLLRVYLLHNCKFLILKCTRFQVVSLDFDNFVQNSGTSPYISAIIKEVISLAVFRIEKNRNYTVMSNYHLRDKSISCKACGLLSKMLALPDDWDYTTRGLAAICKDGLDSIRSALKELEGAGYLERRQLRDDHGRMTDVEYIIYETPLRSEPRTDLPYTENPNTVEPNTVFPDSDNPDSEKPTQLNTNIPITKESKTKRSNGRSVGNNSKTR